ncbi:hypothetical protein Dda_1168 [Drechslerella dactyloides]|uniref:Uncharacterized protein n=1 Tax=Drechslerella dactyloides TaxID=74499 RepID=A0AAD6NPI8_DREDA|nr:hypothetical protein Dda_1168 [Drechslerella dactyloides]
MGRSVGRLVKSSWSCCGPTGYRYQLSQTTRHIWTGRCNALIRGRDASLLTPHRLATFGKWQLGKQVHDDKGGAYWFDEAGLLKQAKEDKEAAEVIGRLDPGSRQGEGDEDVRPRIPKGQWWNHVSLMTPRLRAKQEGLPAPKPEPQLPVEPEEPLPRNYLTKHPITSTQVIDRLFGKESKAFHRFMREARVERQFTLGKLLVDQPEVRTHYEYWLQLLKFRARIHGEKGVKDVWFGVTMRRIQLPISGPVADEIWKIFVRVGLEDDDFLNKVYRYHLHIYHDYGKRRWKPMYDEVVGGLLRKKPFRALWWHHRLIDVNPPDMKKFFKERAANPANLPSLFRIFSTRKVSPLYYNAIIPVICGHEMFETAIDWHRMLFRKGDYPRDSSAADRLFEYYAFHKPLRDIEELLRDFHEKRIRVTESTAISLIKARYRTRIIMDLFCTLYDAKALSTECLGDRFWTFLLTYQGFTEADVTGYMAKLEIQEVGNSTARAFVKRSKNIAAFVRGISLLNRHKIPLDNEVYDKYFEMKARWSPEEALEESLPIENLPVSRGNALLQGYLSTYRWKFFNLVYQKLRRQNPVTWNLFLTRLFITKQLRLALELMEEMRALSIPIWPTAQRELLRILLLPRRLGHHPLTVGPGARKTKDLYMATNYLRALMMNGETVQPTLWREILKRYGMFRKLKDLEDLCLWLVDWYDPRQPAFRKAYTPIKFTDVKRVLSLGYDNEADRIPWTEPPASESNRSPQNPLRLLFPATTVRSLVEWGFISMQRQWVLHLVRRKSRVAVKARLSRCAWGIRLVKKLQDKGVWVDGRSVARAVRVRLRALDGSKFYWDHRDSDKGISKHDPIDLQAMARIAEEAWGEQLFPTGSWDTKEGLSRMLKFPSQYLRRPRRVISPPRSAPVFPERTAIVFSTREVQPNS